MHIDDIQAGDREAAGAIAGMLELYGRPLPERGQAIRGVTKGKRWSGSCAHADQFRVIVEVDADEFIHVSPSDLDIE
jgi:hypothetical protein